MTSLVWLMVPLAMIGVVWVCAVLVAADLDDLSLRRSCPLPYTPTVWVVIPAHDEELCVARAVQSVLDSSYADVSVIVVDDGSTDGTVAALERFGSRVRVVSQPNAGKAAAINTGAGVGAAGVRGGAPVEAGPHRLHAGCAVTARLEPVFIYVVVSATFQTGWFTGVLLLCAVGLPAADGGRVRRLGGCAALNADRAARLPLGRPLGARRAQTHLSARLILLTNPGPS